MLPFAHHTHGIFEMEVMGYDLTPDGPTEHAIAAVVVSVLAVFIVYGAYALVRDVLRWRRRTATA